MLRPPSYEKFDEMKPTEKFESSPFKKRSRLLLVIGWSFIICAVIFLIAAVVLVVVYSGK